MEEIAVLFGKCCSEYTTSVRFGNKRVCCLCCGDQMKCVCVILMCGDEEKKKHRSVNVWKCSCVLMEGGCIFIITVYFLVPEVISDRISANCHPVSSASAKSPPAELHSSRGSGSLCGPGHAARPWGSLILLWMNPVCATDCHIRAQVLARVDELIVSLGGVGIAEERESGWVN